MTGFKREITIQGETFEISFNGKDYGNRRYINVRDVRANKIVKGVWLISEAKWGEMPSNRSYASLREWNDAIVETLDF